MSLFSDFYDRRCLGKENREFFFLIWTQNQTLVMRSDGYAIEISCHIPN
jgi:hypothetical protein